MISYLFPVTMDAFIVSKNKKNHIPLLKKYISYIIHNVITSDHHLNRLILREVKRTRLIL